ncbi:uncharacterized protein LOC123395262 [Hordeum vulgare subsp. vulgare]|uniref:uncharacterized protein LOC123395262 n=1 Tax=Hordeum vulgare subsp. vulgare TaxID=112509 RepID=UPI001D1A5885|nr:uncharacterized protein LOC123395262 [Hordeum vulgare subsp. vulgare]
MATSGRCCRRSVLLVLLIALLGMPSPATAVLGDPNAAQKCRDTCLEGCTGWMVVCHVSCASACAGAGGIGIMSIDNGIPPDHPNHDDLPKPPPLPDLLHHRPLQGAGGIAPSPAPAASSSTSNDAATSIF